MIANIEHIKAEVKMEEILRSFGYQLNSRNRCGCPVHGGKDPNFHVYDDKIGTCWSQCGGKSWSPIDLVMEIKNCTFIEAVEYVANVARIDIEYAKGDRKEAIERSAKEAEIRKTKYAMNEAALKRYEGDRDIQLSERYEFDGREWSGETVTKFRMVFTPDQNQLADSDDLDRNLMLELGLIKQSKHGGYYDFFRNRLLFPIQDHKGQIVGFSGRKRKDDTRKEIPKYKNSSESELYKKKEVLFGLWQNARGIREHGAWMVEGLTDVVTPFDAGLRNLVASCGTAVTDGQLKLLRRFTNELTFLMDGDEAGKKATKTAVEKAIKLGFRTWVVFFPEPKEGEGIEKYDPDSFVRIHGPGGLEVLVEEEKQEGLIWRVMLEYDEKDISKQEAAIHLAGQYIAQVDSEMLADHFTSELISLMGKDAKDHLKKAIQYEKDRLLREANKPKLSDEQQLDIIRYGLYRNKNQYFCSMSTEVEGYPVTNFAIHPIMLSIGSQNSSIIMELTNIYGRKSTLNVDSDLFIEMNTFKKQAAKRGNFLFRESAKGEHFVKIVRKVYDDLKTCYPISTLGWHKQGFFAWSNGIIHLDGSFHPVDDYGIVTFKENKFFLPACSTIHDEILSDDQENLYQEQKNFIHVAEQAAPSFEKWSRMMRQVHGDNGMMAVAWYLAAIYRDIIYDQFDFFPLLNMFGPPGTGKSYLGWSLSYMFGKARRPFNLHDGTDVGFFRRMAQVRNAVAWYDEYNNQVHPKRAQGLKNSYDGAGREKGVKSNDNSTVTTAVNAAIMLSGQEQPTQDIALFTRVISLNFRDAQRSAEKQKTGEELKAIESTGVLSQITSSLMVYRKRIEDHFPIAYDQVRTVMMSMLNGEDVQDRIMKNYLIPLAVVEVLSEKLQFGFPIGDLLNFAIDNLIQQSQSIAAEDDLAVWWQMVEHFVEQRKLWHDQDIIVQELEMLTVQVGTGTATTTINFEQNKKILFLRFTSSYRLYKEQLRREGASGGLNQEAVKYYLRNSPAFLGKIRSKKFNGQAKSCFAFDMSKLGFDLQLSLIEKSKEENDEKAKENETVGDQNQ